MSHKFFDSGIIAEGKPRITNFGDYGFLILKNKYGMFFEIFLNLIEKTAHKCIAIF